MNNEMAKKLYEANIICRVLNLSGWDEGGPRDARGFVKYLRRRGLCRACFADASLAEIWSAIVELYLEKVPIKEDSTVGVSARREEEISRTSFGSLRFASMKIPTWRSTGKRSFRGGSRNDGSGS